MAFGLIYCRLALTTATLGAQAATSGQGVMVARAGAGAFETQNHRDIPAIAARALIAASEKLAAQISIQSLTRGRVGGEMHSMI